MPFSTFQNTFNWDSTGYNFSVDDVLQGTTEQPKFSQQQNYNTDQLLDFNFSNLTSSPADIQQSIPSTSSGATLLTSDLSLAIPWQGQPTTSPNTSQLPQVWPTPTTDYFATPSWNVSPATAQSPTPSLSDDSPVNSDNEDSKPQIIQHTFSTKPSQAKASSTSKATSEHRDRKVSQSSATSKTPIQKSTTARRRQPHNQVERKYREGLNQQLNNLRHAVPSLLPSYDADGNPTPIKTSKAAILATAIEYIKSVEAERDALQRQVQILRGMRV